MLSLSFASLIPTNLDVDAYSLAQAIVLYLNRVRLLLMVFISLGSFYFS